MKIIKKIPYLILILMIWVSCINTVNAQSKKNTIALEAVFTLSFIQLRFTFSRDLIINDISQNSTFLLSSTLGYGIGNSDGNDYVRDQQLFLLEVSPAYRFFKHHRIETGLLYTYERAKEGYLSFTDEDSWEYDSNLRFKLGYRFEDNTLVLKFFITPQINKEIEKLFFGAGLGFGFKF